VDARKSPIKEREALELIENVDEIYASKGKKVVHLNLKTQKPDRAALLGLLLGPTGNLRAPTLRKGRTLIVGFDEEQYEKLLR
jgi:arsenate reductase-like glutaredoxin family protein